MKNAHLVRVRTEHGSVTVWILGLVMILFLAGALAMDMWRVVAYHGTLVGIADKGAVAGAAQVDVEELYENVVVLVPDGAERAAEDFARIQPHWEEGSMTVRAYADRSQVSVEVTGIVQLTLLRIFAPSQGIVLNVRSQASPTVFK